MIKRLILLFGLVFIVIFLTTYRDLLVFESPGAAALVSPVAALDDDKGNTYVVDSSRSRLMRIDRNGVIDLILNASSGRFSEIMDIAVDGAGDIYVLDIRRPDARRYTASEVIQKYSSNGRLLEEIYRTDHKTPVLYRSTMQLLTDGRGAFSFVTVSGDRIFLHSAGGQDVYSFPDAQKLLMRFALDQNGRLLFLTKKGEIYLAGTEGNRLLYRAVARADGGDGVIPWGLSVDKRGDICITDLGNRQVSVLKDGKPVAVYADEGDVLERSIYYLVSARDKIISVNDRGVLILNRDGEATCVESFPVSGKIFLLRLTLWLMPVLLAAYVIALVAAFIRYLVNKNDFVVRFSAAFMTGTVFVTVVLGLLAAKDFTGRMTREMLNHFTIVSRLMANQIPQDAFNSLNSMDDYMSDEYRTVQEQVEKLFSYNGEEYKNMYCVLYKNLDGAIASVYDSDGASDIVNFPYGWSAYEGSDEQRILNTGEPKTYVLESWINGGVLFALSPVYGDDGAPLGLIEVGGDLTAFQKDIRNLLLDSLLNIASIAVAIIMITLEILIFIDARRQMRVKNLATDVQTGAPGLAGCPVPMDMVRTAVFFVYFTVNISTGFLPFYAREMVLRGNGLWGLSVEFLTAVPISTDVFFGALASVTGSLVCKALKVKRALQLSTLLLFGGLFMQFAAPDLIWLSAGSAINGTGWGLLLFVLNLYIATEKDEAERDRGFVGYTAAMTSGINSGVVFGAFLLNWFSQRVVMGVAAFVGLGFVMFVRACLPQLDIPVTEQKSSAKNVSTVRFLMSPAILIFLVTLLIPVIASGTFLVYFFPLVGFDMGIAEKHIGYAFLLNSLTIIFGGALLTRFFSEKIDKPVALAAWSGVYALTFLAFALRQNIPMLLAALILLGFADSFGLPLYTSYFMQRPEVHAYGCDNAMAVCTLMENAAQAIGPFLFSCVLYSGLREGLIVLAAALAALALVFILSSLITRRSSITNGIF
ncbi:MAG: MFS transporter [Synergistaceae bacterium]|nr:MFS transporter [Synergistaceae bacterium]